jgi:poly-gamma-glutamate capsule biosynthesis protein CapA/YwtB (metallophosphatase superfamily)
MPYQKRISFAFLGVVSMISSRKRAQIMTNGMTRRGILGTAAALGAAAILPAEAAQKFRIVLLGQSLIQHDLRAQNWKEMLVFTRMFAGADACFTDLETTIIGSHGGAVTRDPALLHRAEPAVIDCLAAMHVNLFATANNHAFDVGTGGIGDTIDALVQRHQAYAGTGANLAAASAPGYLQSPAGKIALVAMATGSIREGGAATPERAGVNEIRRDSPGVMNEEDVTRFLTAIADARKQSGMVIAYDHNHYWEAKNDDTPPWQKQLARRCIDAGAGIFISHGAPVLQGIEIYRGRPIFYDLGNFLYQSPSAPNPYGPETWRSVIADCSFDGDRLTGATLTPITLNPVGVNGPTDFETRGRPVIATGADAQSTLDHLAAMSLPMGTNIRIAGGVGRLL